MSYPPRPAGERVLTLAMWRGIAFVGAVMAAGTLYALDASLPVCAGVASSVLWLRELTKMLGRRGA